MARYIDADKLIAEYDRVHIGPPGGARKLMEEAPTADVAEVKHGEWKHTDEARHWAGLDECSVCTYHTFDRDDLSHLNYCPNCGAKMDVGKE